MQPHKYQGDLFERQIVCAARIRGLTINKNPLAFKYLAHGKMLPIRAELDFTMMTKNGKICFFDCKSFAGHTFGLSKISPAQVRRACMYNHHHIAAGFLIHLRGSDEILFMRGVDLMFLKTNRLASLRQGKVPACRINVLGRLGELHGDDRLMGLFTP